MVFLLSACQQPAKQQTAKVASIEPTKQKTEQVVENNPAPKESAQEIAKPENLPRPAKAMAKVVPTPEPVPGNKLIKSDKTEKAPVVDIWQPNEAQIARGNELIGGLRSEINRDPTEYEMQKRLQSHMGLSANQAKKVIAALQLNQQ